MTITELEHENARLREQVGRLRTQLADVTESVGRVEERCAKTFEVGKRWMAKAARFEAENAKLRELCAGLLTGYECGYGELCKGCEWDGLGDSKTFSCLPRAKARELGVEVD